MTNKQIEVQILDQQYRLACSAENEATLLEAASRVDAEMTKVRAQSTARGTDRIAVMAALSLASELLLLQRSVRQNEAFPTEEIRRTMQRMNQRIATTIEQHEQNMLASNSDPT
ncbi:cell division protein ZapA [Mycoavidus cysteinexigens]|uniref:Cell division protein ZapA n=1 Tax=Mycoavidus cysteinexigens TaxID=1553431 RepID=A0A2Z6EVL6_9BURK|nr:cell division protein ZapA [Mycoavidus cysteinexigens]BBE09497.1 cell division protein ZapA [Mycoavidus cysteinexigens]GLR01319.1 cell division protein ZapA [Mycoavidus cysteinexigens]